MAFTLTRKTGKGVPVLIGRSDTVGYSDLPGAKRVAESLMQDDAKLISVTIHEGDQSVAIIERKADGPPRWFLLR